MAPPRLLFLAFGFPPAAKSSTYRLLEIGNQFAERGWQVTVLNAPNEVWESDTGVDLSLMQRVHPDITMIPVPVESPQRETDISRFSEERAIAPKRWLKNLREASMQVFPEPAFGAWRPAIEETAVRLHQENPFDLVVVSCTPYVLLSTALRLKREFGVPFAIDFRDGWSIDVVGGEVAFEIDSDQGRWEAEALDEAISLWVVNEPIAEHYRQRYPALADKVSVVRNGHDISAHPHEPQMDSGTPHLKFGYLGTVNYPRETLEFVLECWREARARELTLKDATFELRGYFGAGSHRGAHPALSLVDAAADAGVSYGGPVPKSEVGHVYGDWDALVLILIGGRYVTSGKVYEYMASGLPIVSVHETEHDASTLLGSYPLWTGPTDLDRERVVEAICAAARMATSAGPSERAAALAAAAKYQRRALMSPAIDELVERVTAR